MASLLRGISDRILPGSKQELKSRPDGFNTARQYSNLFTQTNPDVDGEECLHDCESCTVKYPRKFAIDEEDELYGHVKGWSRHILVATGKTDWVRDVADEEGSVMEAVGKHDSKVEGGKLMLSASNIPPPEWHGEGDGAYGKDRPTRVLLLPAFQWIEGVTPNLVPEVIKSVINTAPTNTSLISPASSPQNGHTDLQLPPGLSLHSCNHKYLILLCSQATRDARCGQSAPLLRKELERHLRPLGLFRDLNDERPGGVGIYFISHVGGHKYSANMMVYRRAEGGRSVRDQIEGGAGGGVEVAEVAGKGGDGEAAQCIWLARVKPEDCENIVRFTVLQGKVVKPASQLRGGFDRERGVVSW
ncbi:Actin patches distal protein 1 [Teratosphaeria destructans]|uniref:Actin patches distal protein 1 n=1 Tax=Teratosphaeria destructans TaxID=418781 RepID=A0A9W7SJ91_9PEZI|nr:Actin patches distal protein 1 [Teratosphaeria destructans]